MANMGFNTVADAFVHQKVPRYDKEYVNQRENEWRQNGVHEVYIQKSIAAGMSPMDMQVIDRFAKENFLMIIIRCPNANARLFHGLYAAKMWRVKQKTVNGILQENGRFFVSDYDLMSIWRQMGAGWEKVSIAAIKLSPNDSNHLRGSLTEEATEIIRRLNMAIHRVKGSKIQHGAQDDFDPAQGGQSRGVHPGVKDTDRFVVFSPKEEEPKFIPQYKELESYYASNSLKVNGENAWPYTEKGKFKGLQHT